MLSIPQLADDFKGRVIAPDDPDYESARTVFHGAIDRRPAAIVRVADATDVARVIALARETGLELAVRSGGHSSAGHGVSEGGIVLDLSEMRSLEIDPQERTAWAETGLTAGEYTAAAGEHGLATGFGDTGSVGIGGITLGGGVGFLVRKHGLTIDDLLAAEVVTADGELLRADAETHPDLFWATRRVRPSPPAHARALPRAPGGAGRRARPPHARRAAHGRLGRPARTRAAPIGHRRSSARDGGRERGDPPTRTWNRPLRSGRRASRPDSRLRQHRARKHRAGRPRARRVAVARCSHGRCETASPTS
jgi:FAD/FMN-containing dehydrogenase